MKINEITESKKLKESNDIAEIGRAMMDMAATHKDDEESNQMSSLGDALTRFGTNMGPKNIKDLVKQTGVEPEQIQELMKAAKQHLDQQGPIRTGVSDMDDDGFDQ